LRRLEAQLIVADADQIFVLSGEGDVIAPDDGVVAIGMGAPYAVAAARALSLHTQLPPREVVSEALKITAGLCIFTNDSITIETASRFDQPNDLPSATPKSPERKRRKVGAQ
jgi:ATP-dependent HslUV protease subunit HslV